MAENILPTIEAACNALLSHFNFQFKIKEKQLQVISLSGYFCGSADRLLQKHMLHVAAFDLGQGKDKYCTGYGQVPSRLPVISMSTRFHDKTVEAADNPVYNVPCFLLLLF